MISSTMDDSERAYIDGLNAFVKEQGFALAFDLYLGEPGKTYADYDGFYADYSDNAVSSLDGDAAFIIYGIDTDQYMRDERAQDVYTRGMSVAPAYTERYAAIFNPPQTVVLAPTGSQESPVHRQAVLIRNDTFDQYGGDIRTMSQYRAYLERIKADHPDIVPGAISPLLNDAVAASAPGYTAMALFMPEYGYAMVDGAFARQLGMYLGMAVELGGDDIVHGVTLDAFPLAYKQLIALHTDGLVDLWHARTMQTVAGTKFDIASHPTLIASTHDIATGFAEMTEEYPALTTLDLSQYHMSVLYRDVLPEIPAEAAQYAPAYAVFGSEADAGEFLRFMAWLEHPEHYMRFMYGEEGKDYTLDAKGGVSVLSGGEAFRRWPRLELFTRSYLEPAAQMVLPVNFEAEMAAMTHPHTLKIDFKSAQDIQDAREKSIDAYYDLLSLHMSLFSRSFKEIGYSSDKLIDDFAAAQQGRKDAWMGIADILQRAVGE